MSYIAGWEIRTFSPTRISRASGELVTSRRSNRRISADDRIVMKILICKDARNWISTLFKQIHLCLLNSVGSAVDSVHDQAIGALRGRGGFGVWFSRWFLQIVFTDGFWRWFCDGFAMIFEVAVEMVLEMPSEISLGMPLRPWTSECVSKCFLQWRSFEIALRRLG